MADETTARGCPWCGGQPQPQVSKVNNCGEPYFVVSLCCKNCGVSMQTVAAADDVTAGGAAQNGLPFMWRVAAATIRARLLRRWNTAQ